MRSIECQCTHEYLFREERLAASSALASGGAILAPLPATIDADERRERLERIATEIRRSVVQMISRAKAGHIGGDLSATDFARDPVFCRAARRSARAQRSEARPVHSQQRPLRGGALLDARLARLFPIRTAFDLHAASVGAERSSEPAESPGRRSQHRPARSWAPDRGRQRDCVQVFRARTGEPSSCSATANCRKARTGKRPCARAIAGSTR